MGDNDDDDGKFNNDFSVRHVNFIPALKRSVLRAKIFKR